jgi:ABC-type multidrug transport system ATPase subunit
MFIPQAGLGVPGLTVRDHFRTLEAVYRTGRVSSAIEACGLGNLLDQRAMTLSHGEQLRLSLGLAYARRPAVLVADEPLVGLAPIDQEALGNLMRSMASEGAAVVTSGHDVSVLLEITDVVIWSVAGTTHHLGSPTEARAHEQFKRDYLGPRFATT